MSSQFQFYALYYCKSYTEITRWLVPRGVQTPKIEEAKGFRKRNCVCVCVRARVCECMCVYCTHLSSGVSDLALRAVPRRVARPLRGHALVPPPAVGAPVDRTELIIPTTVQFSHHLYVMYYLLQKNRRQAISL